MIIKVPKNMFFRKINKRQESFSLDYCFSYAGTRELVNLIVGIKKFSYHIPYINIGRKHSKILKNQKTDHGQTELNNMLVKKSVLN